MYIFNELNILNRINDLPDAGMMCTSCYINLKKNYVFHCVFIVIQVLHVLFETFFIYYCCTRVLHVSYNSEIQA